MEDQQRKCPFCNGTGKDPKDKSKPCAVCEGMKKITGSSSRGGGS